MMYDSKVLTPTYHLPEVNCMYQVKKIASVAADSSNNQEVVKVKTCTFDLNILEKKIHLASSGNSAQKSMIEQRQQHVISQLEAIASRLSSIREKCNIGSATSVQQQVSSSSAPTELEDIVIKVNPNQVPYTLLALRNILKNNLNFKVKVFKHSTLSTIGKEAQYFEQQLLEQCKEINTTLPTIDLTLIWLVCEETELIISSAAYVPIYGEMNILRYLARMGVCDLGYNTGIVANEMDQLLDMCHKLLCLKTADCRKSLIERLIVIFGQQQQYLFGSTISLVDIAVYCTLKQVVAAKDLNLPNKEHNQKFAAWRNRVQQIIAV